MVEIIYEPWKTIVIHEIFQYDLEMLVNLQGLGVPTGQLGSPIYWADGVAFVHLNLPPTEEVTKELIQGKLHWRNLFFAFMPKYKKLITIPEGNVRIPILDLSDFEISRSIAEWIKKNYQQK